MDGILSSDFAEGRKKKRSLRYRLWRRGKEVERAIDLYSKKSESLPLRVLDLGCADGLMLLNLSKTFNIEATGVELSNELHEIAIKNCTGMNILKMDLNKLESLKGNEYDVIICTAVLEHLEDATTTINFINNLLANDGITIWTVPDPIWEKIATFVGHLEDDVHHYVPNLDKLKDWAVKNNLEIIEAKKFMFSPIGFPFELTIEKIIRKIRLSFLLANQLIIARKK